jgi:hypothetical protein
MMEHVINAVEYVTIHKEEYAELLILEEKYTRLLDAILENSSLGWDGESIAFSHSIIDMFLRMFEPSNHYATITRLQRQKEQEEKENATDNN